MNNRKANNFMKPLRYVNRDGEVKDSKDVPLSDESLKKFVSNLKRNKKLSEYTMDKDKSNHNRIGRTKRAQHFKDWKEKIDFERNKIEDRDDLDNFLIKRIEERKNEIPHVRPLTNLRMKAHIYKRLVEEYNDMTPAERKEKIKEIKEANTQFKDVDTTGWEYVTLDL